MNKHIVKHSNLFSSISHVGNVFQNGSSCISKRIFMHKRLSTIVLLEGQKEGAVFQHFSACKKIFQDQYGTMPGTSVFPYRYVETLRVR